MKMFTEKRFEKRCPVANVYIWKTIVKIHERCLRGTLQLTSLVIRLF